MSDFWHERVPPEWQDQALDVIEATPWVTYQVLTKRPAMATRRLAALNRHLPRNVWAGATVGHPKSLPLLKPLRRIEAAKRFLSVEPLLAPMVPGLDLTAIDWVIGGGESPSPGHPARPCDPDWMRAVRDFCVAHDTPFFLKQWGVWANNPTPVDEELAPKPRVGRPLMEDFGASFLYDLTALFAIFLDFSQQFIKIELLFCRLEIGLARNLSVGAYHQGKCFRVIGCMDHVVHDPTSPSLTMDWVHYRLTVSEFLLKAPCNHFCADVSLHTKQFVPVGAAPPAINLPLGFSPTDDS